MCNRSETGRSLPVAEHIIQPLPSIVQHVGIGVTTGDKRTKPVTKNKRKTNMRKGANTLREDDVKGKLKIGIIGAGQIGSVLTRHFTRLGHDVVVANSRGPETLADLARETGAKPTQASEVPRGRDLVVVTIPEGKIPDLPRDLFKNGPQNMIVVDTGNYYPRHRDGKIEGIENGLLESRWVEQHLRHPVIKVFNNINYEHLLNRGKPAGTLGRIALPISGDDPKAKQVVMELVNSVGFDPVDAGGLDESWRQQPGTPVYDQDFDAEGVRRALSEARPERKPEWRATPNSPGTWSAPQ
jgi:8-hydroxy-5-deazaflavin:NADPH oxidoreductase